MNVLLLGYFVYLILYGIISYAILFHLIQFRIEGDASGVVMVVYIIISLIIIVGSFLLLKPV